MCVELRAWDVSFAPALAKTIGNKKVQDNLRDGIPFPYTEANAREFIGGVLAAKDVFAFAVFADGLSCGSISVTRGGNVHRRTGELGYYLAEPFWGRGIGTAAVKKMCAFVFENSDIARIFAEPFSQNAASCRVLEKCGFTCEGILRKNAEKNGKLLDMKMYSLLKEEFSPEMKK